MLLPGNRKPPFSNWYYRWVSFIIKHEGKEIAIPTARHDASLRSEDDWRKVGNQKIGNRIGFGPDPDAIVTGYHYHETGSHEMSGKFIQLKKDAYLIFLGNITKGMSPQAGLSSEEHQAIDWLKAQGGRKFELSASDPVQFNNEQFYNTIEYAEAPGGYCFPKELCEEIT